MLSLKNKPVGVDIPVQRMATFLYNQLKDLWQVSDNELKGYGRCYRELIDKGYAPRLFVASIIENNTTYADIDFDDQNDKVLFFFDVHDSTRYQAGTSTVRVELIMICNIQQIKKDIIHRGDEEVRNDVLRLSDTARYGFKLYELVTGYKNVFGRFDAMIANDQASLRDVHPLHVFKICFDLSYDLNAC